MALSIIYFSGQMGNGILYPTVHRHWRYQARPTRSLLMLFDDVQSASRSLHYGVRVIFIEKVVSFSWLSLQAESIYVKTACAEPCSKKLSYDFGHCFFLWQ